MNSELDLNKVMSYYTEEINRSLLGDYYWSVDKMQNRYTLEIPESVKPSIFNDVKVTYSGLDSYFSKITIQGENMETFKLYDGVVVRRNDLNIVVESVWIVAKDRQAADRQLVLELANELPDQDIDTELYEFILIERGTITRPVK